MKSTLRFAAAAAAAAIALIAGPLAETAFAGAQARVTGTVVDHEKKPIAGATVVLTNPKVASYRQEFTTDAKGIFKVLLADSTYTYKYSISAKGYQPLEQEKKAAIGSDVQWEFMLIPEGAVVAGAGQIVEPTKGEKATLAYNEGVALLNAGDAAGAEAKFLAALAEKDDLQVAWWALTRIALDRKDGAKALEYAGKSLTLKEKEQAEAKAAGDEVDEAELAKYLDALARAQELTGDKAGAKATRDRLAKATGDPSALYNEAVTAFNANKMKDAEKKLTQVLELKEDYPLAHYLLGMVSMNGGKNKSAKEHFNRYLELEPEGEKAEEVKAFLSYLPK